MTLARTLVFLMTFAAACDAAAQTSLKFALDWKFEGPSAPYFFAIDQGYFAEVDLDVTVVQGQGSLDAIPKVASGAYPLGFADFNSLIKYVDQNPDAPVVAVMIVYDVPPFAILSTKARGVRTPWDLEGKTLGAPAADGAFAQWPAFVAVADVDPSQVAIKDVAFSEREAMLANGGADAITGYSFTSALALQQQGVAAEDVVVMLMYDFGLRCYGNAVIANKDFAAAHPEIVRSFLTAVVKGWASTIDAPDAAIASLMRRNPSLDPKTEMKRLEMVIIDNVGTANAVEHGMGDVDQERFALALRQLGATYRFNAPPSLEKFFTPDYLPATEDRMLLR